MTNKVGRPPMAEEVKNVKYASTLPRPLYDWLIDHAKRTNQPKSRIITEALLWWSQQNKINGDNHDR